MADKERAGLPEPLAGSLSVLLCVLAGKVDLNASRLLRRSIDVSTTEWRVIATAGAEPGAPPQRVADVAAVDKSVISRAIRNLVDRGLIEARPDPERSRWTCLYLTPAGLDVHAAGRLLADQGEEYVSHALSASERAQLLQLLTRVLTHFPSETNGAE